ncbi:MAG: AMP-binding protein [Akkermansiaceae bacterium]|nr:AMP-binding protein [Akkermansiaceae bacterium]
MDAKLLRDPGFWADDRPLAPAGFAGGLPELEELAGQVLFESSGSSGPPKWLALSKEALLLSAAAVNAHLRVTADSCWGLALPWYHVGGFGVLARAFEAGCRYRTFEPRWQAAGFRDWLVKHEVTHTSLVPAQVHDLTASGVAAPPALRAVVVGGGRLAGEAGRSARALGWPVLASYGMTEAGSQIATQGLELLEKSYEPAAFEVLPIWRVRADAVGRLEIAGPALFSGTLVHVGDEWRFEPRRGEWHVTADRGAIADGRLTPLGRMDTAVKVLGELVDPERIEEELLDGARGGLRAGQFVVVAVPDARAEHRLVPVFEDAVPPRVIAAVLAEYHLRAPGFRRLQNPVRLPALPRSPIGKIRRAELAEWIRKI